jgi:hypothetical protein
MATSAAGRGAASVQGGCDLCVKRPVSVGAIGLAPRSKVPDCFRPRSGRCFGRVPSFACVSFTGGSGVGVAGRTRRRDVGDVAVWPRSGRGCLHRRPWPRQPIMLDIWHTRKTSCECPTSSFPSSTGWCRQPRSAPRSPPTCRQLPGRDPTNGGRSPPRRTRAVGQPPDRGPASAGRPCPQAAGQPHNRRRRVVSRLAAIWQVPPFPPP